jgi:hypothetical protein
VIIRANGDQLLLITQIDHAALAERIMASWRADGLPHSPRRDAILFATRRHDDGWLNDDKAPMVDEATGRVQDYVHAPDNVRRGIWPKGVERLARHPHAAALVAQHALHLFDKYRAEPGWEDFFDRMGRARDAHLAAAAPLTADDLRHDYFFVRMGDLLSLQFCDDWLEPQRYAAYASRWDGGRLVVTPDPFDGGEVPLTVPARCLPARVFSGGDEAAAAFQAAPMVTLTGVASGPRVQ